MNTIRSQILLFAASTFAASTTALAVDTPPSWHGTYNWGSHEHSLTLALEGSVDHITALIFTAAYKEETSHGRIRIIEHNADGSLIGLATVDGDEYRFTGQLEPIRLSGRFARKEFDDWLDEGGLNCIRAGTPTEDQP